MNIVCLFNSVRGYIFLKPCINFITLDILVFWIVTVRVCVGVGVVWGCVCLFFFFCLFLFFERGKGASLQIIIGSVATFTRKM